MIVEVLDDVSTKYSFSLCLEDINTKNIWARIRQTKIWECRKQKLLSVEIDSSLNFDLHVSSLRKKEVACISTVV